MKACIPGKDGGLTLALIVERLEKKKKKKGLTEEEAKALREKEEKEEARFLGDKEDLKAFCEKLHGKTILFDATLDPTGCLAGFILKDVTKRVFLITWRYIHSLRHQCIILASSPEEAAEILGGELTTAVMQHHYWPHRTEMPVIRIKKELFTDKKIPPGPTWNIERLQFRRGDFTVLININEEHADLEIQELPLFTVPSSTL